MDMETAKICQESLHLLRGRDNDFINELYQTVFERDPEIRNVFSIDIDDFKTRQTTLLRMGMVLLDHPDRVGLKLQELGKAHAEYGVKSHHYKVVEDAVIDVLSRYLGEEWCEVYDQAWRRLVQFVSEKMIGGASDKAA